ncbi:MAG: hypothetical protein GY762_18565 [Proteobacteria bacterium]|nr:hypothetical protein [Pseudomonadota bacterium]
MATDLKKNLCILGSGKMARNIGSFFLQKGYSVTWMVSGEGRLPDIETHVQKIVRRLVRAHGGTTTDYPAHFCILGDDPIAKPDVLIECVQEDTTKKQEDVGKMVPFLGEQTIVLTSSSSIMPDKIHPNAVGMHFFYPVELIDFVEVVFPCTYHPETKQRVLQLLGDIGLRYMLQEGENAFVANRLLLPLEAEMFRNMAAGYRPEEVNLCSVSALLPMKQLDFMDAVGLDVIYASVGNYTERMAADDEESCTALRLKLGEIVQSGKRGNKSKNGLLCGERVTWSNERKNLSTREKRELATTYLHLFINTCLRFVERGRVKQASLDTVLDTVFQSEIGLFEALQKERADRVYKTMETAYRETGLSYFKPSGRLERVR